MPLLTGCELRLSSSIWYLLLGPLSHEQPQVKDEQAAHNFEHTKHLSSVER